MRSSSDAIEARNGEIAPDHETVLPQFAHRAEGDNIVVAHRRTGLRIHRQRLTDAITPAFTRKSDVDEPVGCDRQIVFPHGAFKSRAPPIVDRPATDAAE